MLYLYQILISIIIGAVEGVTEFFPISSTGHMIIVHNIFKIENNNIKILEIFIQLGSIFAIFLYFLKKWIHIFNFKTANEKIHTKSVHVIISILPTVFIGFLYYNNIKLLFNTTNIMYGLILGSFFLFFAEIFKPKTYKTININNVTLIQSLIIGIFQALSLYPGFSRSGSTIATGVLLGMKKSVAIEFSFISAVPLLMGASFFDLIKHIQNIFITDIPIFCIGFFVSFTISFLCAKQLLRILVKTSFIVFGIYRLLIAILIFLLIKKVY